MSTTEPSKTALQNAPLKGFRVFDCSQLLPGPLIGKLLAEQGASVFKVENPNRPDPALQMADGVYYRDLNSCKTVLPYDLSEPNEQVRFENELKTVDVLIESFRPRVRSKLGLDPSQLISRFPRLVIVSLTGFPSRSAETNRPAHDLSFQARSGLLSLGAALPAIPLSDIIPPFRAAFEVACARAQREPSGQGARIEVSVLETLKTIQSKWVAEFKTTGSTPSPGTTLVTGRHPCYEIYRSSEGRKFAVSAMEAHYWKLFCETLGLPDLIPDGYSEGARALEVKTKVQARFSKNDFAFWMKTFSTVECCVEPVLNYEEIFTRGL